MHHNGLNTGREDCATISRPWVRVEPKRFGFNGHHRSLMTEARAAFIMRGAQSLFHNVGGF